MHELRVVVFLAAALAAPSLLAQADLSGSPGGPNFVPNGVDVMVYFQQINNAGPSAASNVTFTMNTPPFTKFAGVQNTGTTTFTCSTTPPPGGTGLISCSAPSLPAGGQGIVVVAVRIDAGTPSGTVIPSSYTIGATTPDPDPADNVIVQNTTVQWNVVNAPTAALTVGKTAPPAAAPGDTLTYGITVTNSGPDSASSVTLSDPLPANTTFVSFSQVTGPPLGCPPAPPCEIAMFPVGTATFTMNVMVQGSAAGTTVTNTASVTSPTFQFDHTDDSASASTTISNVVLPPDIEVTNSAPATVVAGTGVITYFPRVRNIGGLPVATVTFTFPIPAQTTFAAGPLPGGFTCVSPPAGASTGSVVCTRATMNPGEDHVLQIAVQPNAGVPHGTVITGTATATTPTPESTTANNSANATTTVLNVADLLTTADGPPPQLIRQHSDVSMRFGILNAGPQPSLGPTFSIPLPAGVTLVSATTPQGSCSGTTTVTCSLGPIARNALTTVTLVIRPTQSGPLSITGTVAGHPDQLDPPGVPNDSLTYTRNVTAVGSPGVTKSFNPPSVQTNGVTRLTITLSNGNSFAVTGVAFTDAYPAGLTNFVLPDAQSTCGGTVTAAPGGTSLALSGGTIPANGSCAVSAFVQAAGNQPIVNELPAGSVTTANAGPNTSAASGAVAVGPAIMPSLSTWGLIALTALLALFAARAIR